VNEKALRAQLARFLNFEEAHVGFDRAVKGIPASARGTVPPDGEHSLWQLVEHIRIAQADILEFCVSATYTAKTWPDDYWPKSRAPRSPMQWTRSLAAIRRDRKTLQRLAANMKIDLLAPVPHGTGQTFLREFLLIADHAAYHVGQIVALRRRLGLWP